MTPLSKEVQEQIEFAALAAYPVNPLYGNPNIDLNDYSRSSWIAGATWYAEKAMAAFPEDATCEICKERTDSFAGNPSLWPVRILEFTYHWICAATKIEKCESLESQLAEKDTRIKELEKEVERLRREIGEVALAGLALGNKANQGNG